MNRLTPEFSNLLRAKIEEQYQQFSNNLGSHDDPYVEWVVSGGELFKARVLAVINSLTFDESEGGVA